MKSKNKIIFPYNNISGYASRVKSARTCHTCVECSDKIEVGSSYISIHEAIFEGAVWKSFPVCESCYNKLLGRNLNYPAPNSSSDTSSSAGARIAQVYQTTDGKVFKDPLEAIAHETFIFGNEKLVLYGTDGRVYDVESAIFAYIPDAEAMYAFDTYCAKSSLYSDKKDSALDQRAYGLFIWDLVAVQFKYVPNAAANALKSFVKFMLDHNNSNI